MLIRIPTLFFESDMIDIYAWDNIYKEIFIFISVLFKWAMIEKYKYLWKIGSFATSDAKGNMIYSDVIPDSLIIFKIKVRLYQCTTNNQVN